MPKKEYPYQNLSMKDIKGEQWEDIPGLDGYFLISNFGRVKRLEYEMQYRNGAIYVKPEKIIKPMIVKQRNKFIGDYTRFLTVRVVLSGKRYNYTVARLVYRCFAESSFDLDDSTKIILARDCDNFNIRPSNLFAATLGQRQVRAFERKRFRSPLLDLPEKLKKEIRKKIIKTKSKQVTQYTLTGKKIKTFSSMAAAAKATGAHAVAIREVATGENITAGGFIWRWGNEKKIEVEDIKGKRRKENRKNYKIVSVTQYDMKGKRIAYYPSLTDAEEATGINGGQISLAAKGIYKSAKGFFWKKGNGKERIDLSGHQWGKTSMAATQSKKVKQYTLAGKYIQTFASVKEAASYAGVNGATMSGTCNGNQKTCKGYKWRFA